MLKAHGRQIAAVATGGILIAALAGCAGGGGGTGSASSNTLTITWNVNEAAGIQAVIDEYQKAHPDITVNLSTVDGGGTGQAALRTQLGSGTASDITWLWPGDGNAGAVQELAAGDFFEDLSDRSWASQYPTAFKDLVGVDGNVEMMAPAASSFPLVVNQTRIDELGLTTPTNWTELMQFCKDARAKGVSALVMQGGDLYGGMSTMFEFVGDLVYADGNQFDSDLISGKTTFPTNAGWIKAMDLFTQLRDSDCYEDGFTGMSFQDGGQLIASGQALGSFSPGVHVGSILQTANPDADFRMVPFQTVDGQSPNMTSISTLGGGAIPKAGKNKDLALDFLDFLAAHTIDYADAIPGNVPTIAVDYTPPGPNEEFLFNALQHNEGAHFLNQFWPSAEMEGVFLSGLQAIDLGQATGPEVLQNMQDSLEKAL